MKYKDCSLLCACAQGGFSMITNIHELKIPNFEKILKETLKESTCIVGPTLYRSLVENDFLDENTTTITIIPDHAEQKEKLEGNTLVFTNFLEALAVSQALSTKETVFLYDEEIVSLALKKIVFQKLKICFVQGKTYPEFSLSKQIPITHLSEYSYKGELYQRDEANAYGFYMRTYTHTL